MIYGMVSTGFKAEKNKETDGLKGKNNFMIARYLKANQT